MKPGSHFGARLFFLILQLLIGCRRPNNCGLYERARRCLASNDARSEVTLMMFSWLKRKGILAALAAASALPAGAITLGQVDTFEDGTTMGWGGGANPSNVATGGPNGAGDHFLQISSVGSFGGRLATFNDIQWSGNYLTAGVNVVEMDLLNMGTVDLSMRAVLFSPTLSRWTSKDAVILPADSVWHHVSFVLTQDAMTLVSGLDDFPTTITGAFRFMVRHQIGAPGSGGSPIASQLGIDNVRASNQVVVFPFSYNMTNGYFGGGTLSSLFFSDDDELQFIGDSVKPSPQVEINGTAPARTPTTLRVTYESSGSRLDMVERLQMWNWNASNWDAQNFSRAITGTDSTATVNFTSNPARFIETTSLAMRSRLSWIPASDVAAGDGWLCQIDLFRWTFIP